MSAIKVLIPSPLQQYTTGADAVGVDAATVEEALEALTKRHSELRRHLYADDGRLRSFVNIYLNDDDIRYLEDGEEAAVKDGDEIRIIPSIAGG